jgi:hypothetical protein
MGTNFDQFPFRQANNFIRREMTVRRSERWLGARPSPELI